MAPTSAPMSVEKPFAKESGVNGDSSEAKSTADALIEPTGVDAAVCMTTDAAVVVGDAIVCLPVRKFLDGADGEI